MSYADDQVSKKYLQRIERLQLAGCLTLLGAIVILGNLMVRHEQQYVRLAESFLNGKLYFVSIPEHWDDTAKYMNRYYWPLGPLPAVILMPFVVLFKHFGGVLYQGYISLPLVFGTAWLCFQVGKKCNRSPEDSLWLTLAFCGSSSYISVAAISMSWPFAQVVADGLIFLAIHEWLRCRRWCLIGIFLGLCATARISAGLNVIFFMGAVSLCEREQRVKNIGSLLVGFAVPMVLLATYNFFRFGSILETGYSYQLRAPGDFALTSLANVIPHLRIFLFGPPLLADDFPFVATNIAGMSIFLLSPWLVYLGSLKLDRLNVLALATCVVVLLAVLSWRSTGQIQVGYRFLLDFLPIIIFLLARSGFRGREITPAFKLLTLLGLISTLYFLMSFMKLIPTG